MADISEQNGLHFADKFFVCVFMIERAIDKSLAFVQVMAWCWAGDKPSPEPAITKKCGII